MAESIDGKKEYNIEHGPAPDYAGERAVDVAIGEAKALYGDIQDAEQYGYVRFRLKQ